MKATTPLKIELKGQIRAGIYHVEKLVECYMTGKKLTQREAQDIQNWVNHNKTV